MAYSDLLKDPRWQKKRLEIFKRDNFTCQFCQDTENTLCVHHKYYIKGLSPWEYEDNCLITLCGSCHEYETENRKEVEKMLIDEIRKCNFSFQDINEIANSFMMVSRLGRTTSRLASNIAEFIGFYNHFKFDDKKTIINYAEETSHLKNGKIKLVVFEDNDE